MQGVDSLTVFAAGEVLDVKFIQVPFRIMFS